MDIFSTSLIATTKKMEFRNFHETLLQTGPMLQVEYMVKPLFHYVWKTVLMTKKPKGKESLQFFSRKIFNLNFLENTLVGFPKLSCCKDIQVAYQGHKAVSDFWD